MQVIRRSGTALTSDQAPRRFLVPAIGTIVALLTVLPAVAGPVPVTQDGPSHLYNAAVSAATRNGSAPFAMFFDTREGVRPNVASHWLLTTLGPRIGWRAAERALLVVALLGGLIAAMMVARRVIPLMVFGGWLASSWFLWMGFYDFVLSVPCFLALVWLLSSTPTTPRHIGVQIALAALYLTHIFTFAAGVTVTLLAFGHRAGATRDGRTAWRELAPALPALALLLLELATGFGGASRWIATLAERLRDAVTGDFVTTIVWLDGSVGAAFVVGLLLTGWRFVAARGGRLPRWNELSPLTLFGALLLMLSIAAPDTIGEGGYVPARMRLLGAAALLPALVEVCRTLSGRARLFLTVPLAIGLVWRSVLLLGEARAMRNVTSEVAALLERAGARDGDWMVTRLTAYRRWPFRIGAYRHLGEREAVERGLIVLNNYEALYGVFSVSWRARPDWVLFRPDDGVLAASLVPGEVAWNGSIFVLHERERLVRAADARLGVVNSYAGPRFAVTTLRQQR